MQVSSHPLIIRLMLVDQLPNFLDVLKDGLQDAAMKSQRILMTGTAFPLELSLALFDFEDEKCCADFSQN
jgi:hypothetical protein